MLMTCLSDPIYNITWKSSEIAQWFIAHKGAAPKPIEFNELALE